MIETLPPTEFYKNLKEYIHSNSTNKELFLEPITTYDNFNPIELKSTDNVSDRIITSLNSKKISLLQGPPGTGKSYTNAEIISKLCTRGNSVCVTTQSNASLISLISQSPIKDLLNQNKIYKTNLSSDESANFPNLKIFCLKKENYYVQLIILYLI